MTSGNRLIAFIGGLLLIPMGFLALDIPALGVGMAPAVAGAAIITAGTVAMATAFADPGPGAPLLDAAIGTVCVIFLLAVGAHPGHFVAWMASGGLVALAGARELWTLAQQRVPARSR